MKTDDDFTVEHGTLAAHVGPTRTVIFDKSVLREVVGDDYPPVMIEGNADDYGINPVRRLYIGRTSDIALANTDFRLIFPSSEEGSPFPSDLAGVSIDNSFLKGKWQGFPVVRWDELTRLIRLSWKNKASMSSALGDVCGDILRHMNKKGSYQAREDLPKEKDNGIKDVDGYFPHIGGHWLVKGNVSVFLAGDRLKAFIGQSPSEGLEKTHPAKLGEARGICQEFSSPESLIPVGASIPRGHVGNPEAALLSLTSAAPYLVSPQDERDLLDILRESLSRREASGVDKTDTPPPITVTELQAIAEEAGHPLLRTIHVDRGAGFIARIQGDLLRVYLPGVTYPTANGSHMVREEDPSDVIFGKEMDREDKQVGIALSLAYVRKEPNKSFVSIHRWLSPKWERHEDALRGGVHTMLDRVEKVARELDIARDIVAVTQFHQYRGWTFFRQGCYMKVFPSSMAKLDMVRSRQWGTLGRLTGEETFPQVDPDEPMPALVPINHWGANIPCALVCNETGNAAGLLGDRLPVYTGQGKERDAGEALSIAKGILGIAKGKPDITEPETVSEADFVVRNGPYVGFVRKGRIFLFVAKQYKEESLWYPTRTLTDVSLPDEAKECDCNPAIEVGPYVHSSHGVSADIESYSKNPEPALCALSSLFLRVRGARHMADPDSFVGVLEDAKDQYLGDKASGEEAEESLADTVGTSPVKEYGAYGSPLAENEFVPFLTEESGSACVITEHDVTIFKEGVPAGNTLPHPLTGSGITRHTSLAGDDSTVAVSVSHAALFTEGGISNMQLSCVMAGLCSEFTATALILGAMAAAKEMKEARPFMEKAQFFACGPLVAYRRGRSVKIVSSSLNSLNIVMDDKSRNERLQEVGVRRCYPNAALTEGKACGVELLLDIDASPKRPVGDDTAARIIEMFPCEDMDITRYEAEEAIGHLLKAVGGALKENVADMIED